jgi:hypothetical protein
MLRAMVAGCTQNWKLGCSASGPRARLKGKGEGQLKRGFSIFEKHSNNEFKREFKFKHPKMMHQHVCNSKLLYFIIYLRKMVKCL